jgi:protease YdgD
MLLAPAAAFGADTRQITRSVLPGLGGDATRVPVDVTTAPWFAIGRLQTEVGEQRTGALIGPRTVLTAAHCLASPTSLHYVQPGSIHFLLG